MKFTISKNITWCHVMEYYSTTGYFKSMNKPTFTPTITTTPQKLISKNYWRSLCCHYMIVHKRVFILFQNVIVD